MLNGNLKYQGSKPDFKLQNFYLNGNVLLMYYDAAYEVHTTRQGITGVITPHHACIMTDTGSADTLIHLLPRQQHRQQSTDLCTVHGPTTIFRGCGVYFSLVSDDGRSAEVNTIKKVTTSFALVDTLCHGHDDTYCTVSKHLVGALCYK